MPTSACRPIGTRAFCRADGRSSAVSVSGQPGASAGWAAAGAGAGAVAGAVGGTPAGAVAGAPAGGGGGGAGVPAPGRPGAKATRPVGWGPLTGATACGCGGSGGAAGAVGGTTGISCVEGDCSRSDGWEPDGVLTDVLLARVPGPRAGLLSGHGNRTARGAPGGRTAP